MFITLEGIDGSGKTTQSRHIVKFLESKGCFCVKTQQPGGTKIGEKIREILLDPKNSRIDPIAELLLYTADRVQHINTFIIPLLKTGKTVVCDRYFDSTLAYQGYARGLDISLIRRLHKAVVNVLKPDLTILLDLSPETGLERARKNIETRFEKESFTFHQKVREGYLKIAGSEPDRFSIIDAGEDESLVFEKIKKAIVPKLG